MKKRIVIITNVPSPYRVDFFYYLQTHFCEEFDFHVIYYCNDSLSRQWKTDESKIMNSHFLKSKTVRIKKRFDDHYISFPVGVGKMLSSLKPDAVVAMEYNPTVILAMHWCRKHHVKYVSWTDGTQTSERNIGKLQKVSRKYIVKHADAFIGSSAASRNNQIRMGADLNKCFISLLTVDIEKYILREEKEYSNTLIYVGSLIERKGVDLLLDALALTNKKINLLIVGDGQEKDSLKAQAKHLGISDRVTFAGFLQREELTKEYAKAGAFILPTREDCFALVLIEAMCASLPVISSKYADGAFETVRENVNGYIVDPFNKEEMATAIENVFENPDIMKKMGQEGFKMIDKFSFENVSKGYLEAIEYVLK